MHAMLGCTHLVRALDVRAGLIWQRQQVQSGDAPACAQRFRCNEAKVRARRAPPIMQLAPTPLLGSGRAVSKHALCPGCAERYVRLHLRTAGVPRSARHLSAKQKRMGIRLASGRGTPTVADVNEAERFRARVKPAWTDCGARLSMLCIVIKAVALSIAAF